MARKDTKVFFAQLFVDGLRCRSELGNYAWNNERHTKSHQSNDFVSYDLD